MYVNGIVRNFYKYFGPFPPSYLTLPGIDEDRLEALTEITVEGKGPGPLLACIVHRDQQPRSRFHLELDEAGSQR
jgi:hypothetical protein